MKRDSLATGHVRPSLQRPDIALVSYKNNGEEQFLELVACNLCGSQRHTKVYEMPDPRYFPEEFFNAVECADCGLGFLNPRPTVEEIGKYYPPEYYRHEPTKSFDRYLHKRFLREAQFLERYAKPPGELLDVGCANGDFPRFMAARGWQVEGVETSDSSQPITDFPVYKQEFDKITIANSTYDAVTAWAVLEHVHDPKAYFRKASQVLKKGGVFVFLVTNFHSVTSRHLFCEDVPRHLYFYTRQTVRRYLQETGLTLEKEDNGGSIYKMSPKNWLPYMLQTKLRGKPFHYRDLPVSSREFRKTRGLPRGLRAAVQYAAYSPAATLDRILTPFVEAAQVLRKSYCISAYVARKL
jgi:2-polyprenyl-3-methyl-5-hydroxy-6-metoxy-1,4-benzoquinol methylase